MGQRVKVRDFRSSRAAWIHAIVIEKIGVCTYVVRVSNAEGLL